MNLIEVRWGSDVSGENTEMEDRNEVNRSRGKERDEVESVRALSFCQNWRARTVSLQKNLQQFERTLA